MTITDAFKALHLNTYLRSVLTAVLRNPLSICLAPSIGIAHCSRFNLRYILSRWLIINSVLARGMILMLWCFGRC